MDESQSTTIAETPIEAPAAVTHPAVTDPAPYRGAAPPAPAPRPTSHAVLRPRELAIAGALVALFDVALWRGNDVASGGFGLAVLFVAAPALVLLGAARWRRTPRLYVLAALLVTVAARTAVDPTFGTGALGICLLGALPIALRRRRTFVPEIVASWSYALAAVPSRLIAAFVGARRVTRGSRLGNVSVLPILVPAALCAVFLLVFAVANPVVAQLLERAWQALALFGVPSIGRMLGWSFFALVALAWLRPVPVAQRGSEDAAREDAAAEVDLAIARNALVGLNVLFVAYLALDATYLVSGHPPTGMTTQEYAHQGAAWLTVALGMLTAVVAYFFRGALAYAARAAIARRAAWLWMAQGVVLALGCYRRIGIHVEHTGLSDLRIVGVLGTTLVLLGMGLVAWKLRAGKSALWLVRRQLDALLVAAVFYAVLPTHWIAANVNVARMNAGEYGPTLHLFRQSRVTESAPVLIGLLEHPDPRIRRGVAALLNEERATLRASIDAQHSWREGDLLGPAALAALDAAQERIAFELGTTTDNDARTVLWQIAQAADDDWSAEAIRDIRSEYDEYE